MWLLFTNGIVENFIELRDELIDEGVEFKSETDTEVIVHLVERFLTAGDGFVQAVRKSLSLLKGAHGVVVMSKTYPETLIAARIGNGVGS